MPKCYLRYWNDLHLLTIVICEVPTLARHYIDYKLIALFNRGPAYPCGGGHEWRQLIYCCNDPLQFSDALEHGDIIFAVDVDDYLTYYWDTADNGKTSIHMLFSSHSHDFRTMALLEYEYSWHLDMNVAQ